MERELIEALNTIMHEIYPKEEPAKINGVKELELFTTKDLILKKLRIMKL